MDFELQFGRRGASGRRNPTDGRRRILVLGDFAGRGARDGAAPEPLAGRSIVRVPQDGDGIQTAIRALSPTLALPSSIAGAGAVLEITSLDDFHPDALFRRLPIFREPPRAAAPASPASSDGDDLARLLGKRPASASAAASPASTIDALIGQIIAGHVVSAPADAPLDTGALGRILRAVLHEPAFQALEARWRALDLLASRAEASVEIMVLDVTRAELDPGALAKRILSPPGGRPFAALIADFAFGPGADDTTRLAQLGALAAQAGAPFIADAAPALVGCASLAGAADPATWEALPPEDAQRWQVLRHAAAAASIGLALPRFLARAPYAAKTNPIEAFAFDEIDGRPAPEALCWASGAFLCALALARGDEAEDANEIDDLPFFSFRADGDLEMYPSTEVFWGQRAADAALSRGLMPVLSARDRNLARLVRLQSIADPPTALAFAGDDGG